MAINQHTRRHVLAAMGALPVAAMAIPTIGHATTNDGGRFARRLAIYRQRIAQHDAFHAQHVMPICREYDRLYPRDVRHESAAAKAMFAECCEAEQRFGEYVGRTNTACHNLLLSPSPDSAALATKLQVMLDEGMFMCGGVDEIGGVLLTDARRLNGEA